LPDPDSDLPENIEVELSRLVAQGAEQLLQLHKSQAQQQQAQQQMQDPIVQMQQAELKIKGQDLQIKAQKAAADTQLAQAKLQLDAQKMETTKEIEMARIQAQDKQSNQRVNVDLFKRGNK
jgi:sulfate adenylyltransferase subunit 1 (EFTu-like GTPase family)